MSKKVAAGKWTGEQLAAITARGCSLLVSAAAGAGKTAVLVERILNRLRDEERPVDIDRLLVVTFTNAAAAEMRERIASAISSDLGGGGDGGRLGLQLALLNKARITTIHSFCMDVLKQYFYRLDLDPGFRIADETESMMLKADVLEELLESEYSVEGENSGFKELAECYGGDLEDTELMQLVTRIHDFSRSDPDPARWLEKAAGRFRSFSEPGGGLDQLTAGVLSEAAGTLEGVLAEMGLALDLCLKPGGPGPYAGTIEGEMAMIRDLLGSCRKGWNQAYRSYREIQFAALKKAGPGVDERLKERVSSIRNRAKRIIKSLGEDFLSRPLEDHAADLKRVAPVMAALAALAARFGENYRRAKVLRGLADFSDLEHYCLQILAERGEGGDLKPSPVALELREQFEEVLVDEYQDINPVQEAIIKMAARSGDGDANLFMVGDVKQSIYRFRLADPTLFLEKYRSFSVLAGSKSRRINLSRNFRSRREIIDAVNYLFRRIMTREAAELDYDAEAELAFGAVMFGGDGEENPRERRVELHLLDRSQMKPEGGAGPEDEGGEAENAGESYEEDIFNDEEELGPVQAEARLVAGRIRELIDGGIGVYDGGLQSFRPATNRDVVILMRATRGRAAVFMDELKRAGIPAYAEPDSGYFQATEIETMVSLLKLVDNPRQDIPLAAVLRSPVAGLGCGEMAVVRMAQKSGDLWDALNEAAKSASGDLAAKLSGFIASLNRWRELGRRATMTELIWTIYRETGYYHYAGAMPGGAQRQANLRALHHWAGQFEATTFRGVFSFLRFIDRMREKGEDPGRAGTLGEGENVVRIMSIHKSKGLEFPVVVVSGLGSRFNRQDLNCDVLLHRELGFGPMLVDPGAGVAYPTLARLAVRERLRREALAEEMRILYVAMTRAREKLILTGSAANLQRSLALWSRNIREGIPARVVLGAGSYLDWICPALAGHPDGEPLRSTEAEGVVGINEQGENSRWLVNICRLPEPGETPGDSRDRASEDIDIERIRAGERVDAGGAYAEEVQRRLSWTYPARDVSGKPAKISVTGLKDAVPAVPPPPYEEELGGLPADDGRQNLWFLKPAYARPAFMAARRELTAAERGSAVHAVMRHLDLRGGLDARGVLDQVARMAERDLITGEQAAVVDCGQIARFFLSATGRRVLAAKSVKREVPFSLALPAEELYPDLRGRHTGERVLIQGVIDCLAEEDGGYLLIDYKTDRFTGRDASGTAEKYRDQVEMYARAVEALTGRPVKERYLYFFDSGMELRV